MVSRDLLAEYAAKGKFGGFQSRQLTLFTGLLKSEKRIRDQRHKLHMKKLHMIVYIPFRMAGPHKNSTLVFAGIVATHEINNFIG